MNIEDGEKKVAVDRREEKEEKVGHRCTVDVGLC